MEGMSKECPCCESHKQAMVDNDSPYLFPSMTFIEGLGYKCTICGYIESDDGK